MPSSVNDNYGADIAPLDVTPCCATTVLANVTAEANVDPALTVKLSAASLPIVALPEDVKLSIERVPEKLADTRVLFSRVCVAFNVTNWSVVLVNPSLDGNVYTFVNPAVKFAVLNLAIFVSSIELGIIKFRSLIAKTEPRRILPVPCADMVKSRF